MAGQIGDQWRYERHDDAEINFSLYTVSVDAGEDGRPQDFGQQIAEGWWHGDPEQLWAATAAPVMLSVLRAAHAHLKGFRYDPPNAAHDHVLRQIERAIHEATHDPNNLYDGPYGDEEPPDEEPDGAIVNLEP